MNEWLKLSEKRSLEILNQVNNQTGLPTDAIEKDWLIEDQLYNKLNKLKKSNPEAFYYWFKSFNL